MGRYWGRLRDFGYGFGFGRDVDNGSFGMMVESVQGESWRGCEFCGEMEAESGVSGV